MNRTLAIDDSATVVISHLIKPGREADYEAWLAEITPAAKTWPGHLGAQIIRPVPGATAKYTVIIRFDRRDHLLPWMGSPQRKALIEKAQDVFADADRFDVLDGLDFWFTPDAARAKIPTRWKQFLVTWSAIFPLSTGAALLLAPLLRLLGISAQPLVANLAGTGLVVALMVYVVMPRYTRLVHAWLFR